MKLSRIIKYIRESLGISQEEFAVKIGVERLAVIRWENEKVTPNKMAQNRLYEIAKKNKVNIYDFMVKDLPEHKVMGIQSPCITAQKPEWKATSDRQAGSGAISGKAFTWERKYNNR